MNENVQNVNEKLEEKPENMRLNSANSKTKVCKNVIGYKIFNICILKKTFFFFVVFVFVYIKCIKYQLKDIKTLILNI